MTITAEWMSPTQASLRLGVGRQMILRLVKQGRLVAVMTANGRLIEPESVEREIERRQGKG